MWNSSYFNLSQNCVIFIAAGPTIFAKTGTKLPVSIVILSIQDNSKLLFC